ncbi:MAG: low temperature requirement protein A [Mycoplasmatales bacterium]|nr:low temperature requirement protein A [Mycoplasmatales bacterium]
MLKHFICNTEKKASTSLEIFFDFIVVATVSMIFNGFILNSHPAPAYQKVFMVFNTGLITTYWYSYSFFRQRFEKNNIFFRILTMVKVISLGIIATGLDLMIFRLNVVADKDPEWIAKFSMIIWVSGFAFSRMISSFEYALSLIANKKDETLIKLLIGKMISRIVVVILNIIHLILLIKGKSIPILTYVFLPLYLVIEFMGNIAYVTDANLKKTPKISIKYASQRYKKLTYLYIGSLFISGTIQFAYYLHNSSDLYMIYRLVLIYFTGFSLWWFYSEYSHKLIIKTKAKHLIKLAFLNIFIQGSLAVFGGAIINSHNSINAHYIMIAAPTALAIFLIGIHLYLSSLNRDDTVTILNFKKQALFICISNVIVLIAYSITSHFVKMPIWTVYIVIDFALIVSTALPYILTRKYCNELEKCKLREK